MRQVDFVKSQLALKFAQDNTKLMKQSPPEAVDQLRRIVGSKNVLTGQDARPWGRDWYENTTWSPLAVVRPSSTDEVSAVVRVAHDSKIPVVPVSGNTGLSQGTHAEHSIMISLDRLSRIREIRPSGRVAVVEAGVVLSNLQDAVEEHGLAFPVTFGARQSAMIGGILSTNAGGSNVVRYGSTRGLCLGIEAVLPDGRILDLMGAMYKDNSGYDLRNLLIGAEGTLGIITAAVVKLFSKPCAYATAMVAISSLDAALNLLHTLQSETGGAVEAFELMPDTFIEAHLKRFPDAKAPFKDMHEINIMIEIGALSQRDASPSDDGSIPIADVLEEILAREYEAGTVLDAVVARSEAQRGEMWARRESAAELSRLHKPMIHNDVAVPLDRVGDLLNGIMTRAFELDPGIRFLNVAHLGDGNLHFTAWPESLDPETHEAINLAVEDEAIALGGSFSAEHGIGISKLNSMTRHKNPVAIDVMRTLKNALDPHGIMNPGKLVP